MSVGVIDASIAIKWVIEEDGTAEALALRRDRKLIAPDLLVSECANVLWKKVVRRELDRKEALIAAQLLSGAEIELFGTRALFEAAVKLALKLNYPAYDCAYLALAIEHGCPFITADEGFVRKIRMNRAPALRESVLLLRQMQTTGTKPDLKEK